MNKIIAATIVGIAITLGACSQPSSSSSSSSAAATMALTIQESETLGTGGFMSFYPTSAYIKTLGAYQVLNSLSGNTAYIVYSVHASETGTAKMRFRYCFGGTETNIRDAWIIVNGVKVTVDTDQILEFAYTSITDGKWTTYGYTDYIEVPFIAGDNEIRLAAVSTADYTRTITYIRGAVGTTAAGTVSGLPNIECLEIVADTIVSAGTGETAFYTLSTSVNSGTGTISSNSVQDYYLPGSQVVLTATAETGYVFDSWGGDLPSTDNPYTLTMSANRVITARFIPSGAAQPSSLAGFGAVQDDSATAYTLTGGFGGTAVTASTLTDLTTYLAGTTPYIITIEGTITSGSETVSASIPVGSNKTIYGSTSNQGHLKNIELKFSGSNCIVRNMIFSEVVAADTYGGAGNDAIQINGGQHIWIDHCEFYSRLDGPTTGMIDVDNSGTIDSDDYKDYYDGLLDIKNGASFITVSFCYFHDHWKAILIGSGDGAENAATDGKARITFHHNYFKDVVSRQPLIRYGKAHIYNNYFLGDAKQIDSTVNARCGAEVYVQGNYTTNAKYTVGFFYETSAISTGSWNLADNTYDNCTNSTETSTSNWVPMYKWSADASSGISSSVPAAAGVGKITF